jgi:hypothetical protein
MIFFNFKKKFKVSYPYPLGHPIKVVVRRYNMRGLLGWLFQKYASTVKPEEILVSERIVELPLLHQWLGSNKVEGKILEVGHAASSVALELASLGHSVTGIDLRSYLFTHANLTSFTDDFLIHDFQNDKFDFIYSLSVIEHFGFTQRYDGKKDVDNQLDEEAFCKMSKLLNQSGRVVISVPYAREQGPSTWFRLYTRDDLNKKLNKHFSIVDQKFYVRKNSQWNQVTDPLDDPDSARDGVAMFLLSIKN